MSGLSPGPWMFREGDWHRYVITAPEGIVAETRSAEVARLICLAPELLAMLRTIRDTPAAFEALDFKKRDALLSVIDRAMGFPPSTPASEGGR